MQEKGMRVGKLLYLKAKRHFVLKPVMAAIALKKTRPDTQPLVADGWAGAVMRVFPLFDSIITEGRTNGRTKPLTELRVRN